MTWTRAASTYRRRTLRGSGTRRRSCKRAWWDDSFRALMRFQVDRAHALFDEGAPLVDLVDGAARLDVALFTLGGRHILKAIERRSYDVLSGRPTLSKAARAWLAASTAVRLKLQRKI